MIARREAVRRLLRAVESAAAQARIDLEQREPGLPVSGLVARFAEQLIPLDGDRRSEFYVWLAMSEGARCSPASSRWIKVTPRAHLNALSAAPSD